MLNFKVCSSADETDTTEFKLVKEDNGDVLLESKVSSDSSWWSLIRFKQSGRIELVKSVGKDIGLDLDKEHRLRFQ